MESWSTIEIIILKIFLKKKPLKKIWKKGRRKNLNEKNKSGQEMSKDREVRHGMTESITEKMQREGNSLTFREERTWIISPTKEDKETCKTE